MLNLGKYRKNIVTRFHLCFDKVYFQKFMYSFNKYFLQICRKYVRNYIRC